MMLEQLYDNFFIIKTAATQVVDPKCLLEQIVNEYVAEFGDEKMQHTSLREYVKIMVTYLESNEKTIFLQRMLMAILYLKKLSINLEELKDNIYFIMDFILDPLSRSEETLKHLSPQLYSVISYDPVIYNIINWNPKFTRIPKLQIHPAFPETDDLVIEGEGGKVKEISVTDNVYNCCVVLIKSTFREEINYHFLHLLPTVSIYNILYNKDSSSNGLSIKKYIETNLLVEDGNIPKLEIIVLYGSRSSTLAREIEIQELQSNPRYSDKIDLRCITMPTGLVGFAAAFNPENSDVIIQTFIDCNRTKGKCFSLTTCFSYLEKTATICNLIGILNCEDVFNIIRNVAIQSKDLSHLSAQITNEYIDKFGDDKIGWHSLSEFIKLDLDYLDYTSSDPNEKIFLLQRMLMTLLYIKKLNINPKELKENIHLLMMFILESRFRDYYLLQKLCKSSPLLYNMLSFDRIIYKIMNWNPAFISTPQLKVNEIFPEELSSATEATDEGISPIIKENTGKEVSHFSGVTKVYNSSIAIIKIRYREMDPVIYHLIYLLPTKYSAPNTLTLKKYIDHWILNLPNSSLPFYKSKSFQEVPKIDIILLCGSRSFTPVKEQEVRILQTNPKYRGKINTRLITIPTGMFSFNAAFYPEEEKVIIQTFTDEYTKRESFVLRNCFLYLEKTPPLASTLALGISEKNLF